VAGCGGPSQWTAPVDGFRPDFFSDDYRRIVNARPAAGEHLAELGDPGARAFGDQIALMTARKSAPASTRGSHFSCVMPPIAQHGTSVVSLQSRKSSAWRLAALVVLGKSAERDVGDAGFRGGDGAVATGAAGDPDGMVGPEQPPGHTAHTAKPVSLCCGKEARCRCEGKDTWERKACVRSRSVWSDS
jgi:hypothetical protein